MAVNCTGAKKGRMENWDHRANKRIWLRRAIYFTPAEEYMEFDIICVPMWALDIFLLISRRS